MPPLLTKARPSAMNGSELRQRIRDARSNQCLVCTGSREKVLKMAIKNVAVDSRLCWGVPTGSFW